MGSVPKPPARPPDEVPWPKPPPPPRPPAPPPAARCTPRPLTRTRMPRTKAFALTGTAELNAMIERVAPDILELLGDGVPRKKAAIVGALATRYARDDVELALIRLAVTDRVEETGRKYVLGATGEGS